MKRNLFFALGILLLSACNNNEIKPDKPSSANEPQQLTYTITATYPHDPTSFTEGLEWRDSSLYESTGNYGESKLARIKLTEGKAIKSMSLSKEFFGEGITVLNGKIYQMTYKENKAFMYDAKTFTKLKEFTYDGEGWGLTNDGKQLIMSNGGSDLFFRDPETFAVTKKITVSNNYGPLTQINELEYVDGFVFANLWTTNKIIKIDLNTGKVVAEADFSDLLKKYPPENQVDVLNGIAYDSVGKRFFITGKYYPKIFEVKLN